MKDGKEVVIRPIRPEDEPLMIQFHQKLSERSVYLRYFQPLKLTQRTSHERLTRICFIDYNREMALVAERKNEAGEPEMLAVGRLSKIHGRDEAELAAVAIDAAQHKGLGTELYRRLISWRARRGWSRSRFPTCCRKIVKCGHCASNWGSRCTQAWKTI